MGDEPVQQRGRPHDSLLQGEPGQRAIRSRRSADLDRLVGRSSVQPTRRWRAASQRGDRPVLGSQLLGTYAIQVPSTYSKLRFWRDTSIASLQSGQSATLSAESLGYEWDVDMDNGFRPPGEIDMSSTTETPPQVNLTYNEDTRFRHGDPSPDAVSGLQRRARLRRGNRPVVLGA